MNIDILVVIVIWIFFVILCVFELKKYIESHGKLKYHNNNSQRNKSHAHVITKELIEVPLSEYRSVQYKAVINGSGFVIRKDMKEALEIFVKCGMSIVETLEKVELKLYEVLERISDTETTVPDEYLDNAYKIFNDSLGKIIKDTYVVSSRMEFIGDSDAEEMRVLSVSNKTMEYYFKLVDTLAELTEAHYIVDYKFYNIVSRKYSKHTNSFVEISQQFMFLTGMLLMGCASKFDKVIYTVIESDMNGR